MMKESYARPWSEGEKEIIRKTLLSEARKLSKNMAFRKQL